MKVMPDEEGCRYWGYKPASAEFLHDAMPRAEKDAIRRKHTVDRAAIKASGWNPVAMGFHTIAAAKAVALRVEAETGVEMMVYPHDYI